MLWLEKRGEGRAKARPYTLHAAAKSRALTRTGVAEQAVSPSAYHGRR
jgi:hypothetical protein